MSWPSGPIGVNLGVDIRCTLAAALALGVTTIPASASYIDTRIDPEPYAWIQSDGEVRAWNLPEENVEEIVVEASMLINYPDYVVVTNCVIYSDSEDLMDRIIYLEGASTD